MEIKNNRIRYLSLFSGIGGFELGIQQAYENLQNISDPEEQQHEAKNSDDSQGGVDSDGEKRLGNPVCIGYSEIDKYAIQIYQKHFPEHKNYGDINLVRAYDLPDFDLLVGGFPCQSFSIAGQRKGFEDTRGTLFFEIARILRKKQPRLVLLENVKGLLSHDEGRTFRIIISTLDELGYDLQWQVLNSKNFGVPQNRERVFIVGHLRGTPRPEVFPITGAVQEDIRNVGEDLSYALDANYHKGTNTLEKGRRQLIQSNKSDKQQEWNQSNSTNRIRREAYTNGARIRRLTPVECMRLQGFPDNWCDGLSDTQKYKCAGNAVTVNVIKVIVEKLL